MTAPPTSPLYGARCDRAAKARAGFRSAFSSPEALSAHMRRIGQLGNASRVALGDVDPFALRQAIAILERVAAHAEATTVPEAEQAITDGLQ